MSHSLLPCPFWYVAPFIAPTLLLDSSVLSSRNEGHSVARFLRHSGLFSTICQAWFHNNLYLVICWSQTEVSWAASACCMAMPSRLLAGSGCKASASDTIALYQDYYLNGGLCVVFLFWVCFCMDVLPWIFWNCNDSLLFGWCLMVLSHQCGEVHHPPSNRQAIAVWRNIPEQSRKTLFAHWLGACHPLKCTENFLREGCEAILWDVSLLFSRHPLFHCSFPPASLKMPWSLLFDLIQLVGT